MSSTKTPPAPARAVAKSHHEKSDPNRTVPFSTRLPAFVVTELEAAAGVGTGSAMARDILNKWAEARRQK